MVMMDTVITIQTVGEDDLAAVDRAFEWFRRIENACSRFEPASEVQRLASRVNEAVAVSDILFEFGVGKVTDSLAERRVESFKTTVPAASEAIRSLRYSILLASTAGGLSKDMGSSVCTRWTDLGGATASCDTSKGQLYQLASGSLTLRNLMP